ncbi:MAG: hypothetical protein LUD12_12215 [Lachnospiraceae bacterium]|nr:hypothetical protein [Lachnospiraceae bacterium]
MKEYRVDVFKNMKHTKHFFDTKAEAETFGKSQKDASVFLLKAISNDIYDVLATIDN